MDPNFARGWDGLAAGVELAVGWVARPLTAGRPARWQRYDWKAGGFGEWQETPWAPVVILEGCGTGSAALRPYASTTVWVDTPASLRDDRLRARIDWPGYAPNRTRWKAQEEALFAVERPWVHADAIIDTAHSIERLDRTGLREHPRSVPLPHPLEARTAWARAVFQEFDLRGRLAEVHARPGERIVLQRAFDLRQHDLGRPQRCRLVAHRLIATVKLAPRVIVTFHQGGRLGVVAGSIGYPPLAIVKKRGFLVDLPRFTVQREGAFDGCLGH